MKLNFDKQKFKQRLIINLTVISIIVCLMLMLSMMNYLFVNVSSEYKTMIYAKELTDNINSKNLTLPIPAADDYITVEGRFDKRTQIYIDNFDLPLRNFTYFIQQNYYYKEGTYDCKYWSYVWTLYWKQNKDKYDWKMKYIDTENHIFVMVYNSSGYVIMDGNDVIDTTAR